jgi:hypothetical protein
LMWTASMTPFSACLSGPHCAAGDGKETPAIIESQ